VINDDTMTVRMSLAEKAEALHRDLTVPRSAITGQNYDRIVMTVDNPEELATRLSS